jgi:hypothetical protein
MNKNKEMEAIDILKIITEALDKNEETKSTSVTCFDPHKMEKKVTRYIFEMDVNGGKSKRFAITVEDLKIK